MVECGCEEVVHAHLNEKLQVDFLCYIQLATRLVGYEYGGRVWV